MLAMDTSLSMRVADVKPTRMAAAQDAARTFLRDLPRNIDVGLVTFAGSAQVAQRATLDRSALSNAIDAIQMQYGTAIGSAIVVCLAELFPDQGIDVGDMTFGTKRKAPGRQQGDTAPPKQITPVAPGSYGSAAIILLSDGRRTTGVDTLDAAKMAADRGVRIDVIGLGTVDGGVASGDGMAIYTAVIALVRAHCLSAAQGPAARFSPAPAAERSTTRRPVPPPTPRSRFADLPMRRTTHRSSSARRSGRTQRRT